MKTRYRLSITFSCLIAALLCYALGATVGFGIFIGAGALFELAFWVRIFKGFRRSNSYKREYRKYKRCSQSIPGQVPEEKCTSARWCAGSRGANPDYFALLTIYSALL